MKTFKTQTTNLQNNTITSTHKTYRDALAQAKKIGTQPNSIKTIIINKEGKTLNTLKNTFWMLNTSII